MFCLRQIIVIVFFFLISFSSFNPEPIFAKSIDLTTTSQTTQTSTTTATTTIATTKTTTNSEHKCDDGSRSKNGDCPSNFPKWVIAIIVIFLIIILCALAVAIYIFKKKRRNLVSPNHLPDFKDSIKQSRPPSNSNGYTPPPTEMQAEAIKERNEQADGMKEGTIYVNEDSVRKPSHHPKNVSIEMKEIAQDSTYVIEEENDKVLYQNTGYKINTLIPPPKKKNRENDGGDKRRGAGSRGGVKKSHTDVDKKILTRNNEKKKTKTQDTYVNGQEISFR